MSWDTLLSILKSNAQDVQQQLLDPPIACPNDGTPLESGPNGTLHCPFDGWVYNQ